VWVRCRISRVTCGHQDCRYEAEVLVKGAVAAGVARRAWRAGNCWGVVYAESIVPLCLCNLEQARFVISTRAGCCEQVGGRLHPLNRSMGWEVAWLFALLLHDLERGSTLKGQEHSFCSLGG
jgi:hypothetical protein